MYGTTEILEAYISELSLKRASKLGEPQPYITVTPLLTPFKPCLLRSAMLIASLLKELVIVLA